MTREELSESIKAFLADRIDSVEQINILGLLQGDPDREWSCSEICQELRSTEPSIRMRLEGLYTADVLIRSTSTSGRFQFSPSSEEVRGQIAELVEIFRTRPYRVIDFIYSGPAESLRAFADAFKLRKDKK